MQHNQQMPPQHQARQPGIEQKMEPKPVYLSPNYQGSNKLKDKVAIITGGDSGIGRAVACAFVIEGARVVIQYLNEHKDAQETEQIINDMGGECLLIPANLQSHDACQQVVQRAIEKYHKLDILVNNCAGQVLHPNGGVIVNS